MTQSHVTSHQAEIKMQDQIDFPENFQHTSLKARSNTPILDLSCHNVQGINVWANTAPRGWGGSTPGPSGLPKGPAKQQPPPSFNLQPATPSIEQSLEQARLEEHKEMRFEQEMQMRQEEMIQAEVEQQQMTMQQEQQRIMMEQQQQQLEMERQHEEALEMQRQQDLQRQQEIEMYEMQRQQQ